MVPSDTGVVRASVLVLVVGLALYGSLIVSPAGRVILSPKVRRATARAQGAEIVHGLTLLPGADKASGASCEHRHLTIREPRQRGACPVKSLKWWNYVAPGGRMKNFFRVTAL